MSYRSEERNKRAIERLEAFLTPDERGHFPLAYFGAGLCPKFGSWGRLISELAKEIGIDPADLEGTEIDKAQVLYEANRSCCDDFLRRTFSPVPSLEDCSDTLRLLVELRFHAYLTTNYDKSIESVYWKVHQQSTKVMSYPNIYFSEIVENSLLYVHGTVTEGETPSLVFNRSSYAEAYNSDSRTGRRGMLTDFWMNVFKEKRLVVSGVGIHNKHEPFQKILADMRRLRILREATQEKCQYLFLTQSLAAKSGGKARTQDEEDDIEKDYRKYYGIEVVFYDQIDDNHKGLKDIFYQVDLRKNSLRSPFSYDTNMNNFGKYVEDDRK